ncbi:MAG: dihydropteroate synthase [Spirochaetia bacterium]
MAVRVHMSATDTGNIPYKIDFEKCKRVKIMGIINVTPDSFYTNSRHDTEDAVQTAVQMEELGADIIDIGGESSRPGADYVSEEVEFERVIPVIRKLRPLLNSTISVDTRKSGIAKAALEAGADIINDISALRDDPELADIISEYRCQIVLMHMRGTPKNMQKDPKYHNVIDQIVHELTGFAESAVKRGISEDQIILDPGIGFGKRIRDNLMIIKHLQQIKDIGFPVLMALSRKSFIGKVQKSLQEDRLFGTITADIISILHGADIIRVHDVLAAKQSILMLEAIENAENYRE